MCNPMHTHSTPWWILSCTTKQPEVPLYFWADRSIGRGIALDGIVSEEGGRGREKKVPRYEKLNASHDSRTLPKTICIIATIND